MPQTSLIRCTLVTCTRTIQIWYSSLAYRLAIVSFWLVTILDVWYDASLLNI
jgi:hypothetical protein